MAVFDVANNEWLRGAYSRNFMEYYEMDSAERYRGNTDKVDMLLRLIDSRGDEKMMSQ